jgi:hypothetical protein
MRYRLYKRITGIVILMSFLTIRGYGEPPMTQTPNSSGSGTRLYNDLEIDLLIDDLTEAAEEAIEAAAAEAAKAAVMASLEREAAILAEARRVRGEYAALKSRSIRVGVLTGVICFLGGFVIGAVAIR